jgi:hypothetical protein
MEGTPKFKTIFTEQLEKLENDYQKKTKYTKKVWGVKKIMYFPTFTIFIGIFWGVFSGGNLIKQGDMLFWLVNFVIAIVVIVLGVLLMRMMNASMDKKNKDRIESLPVYMGRIVVGNDDYCIYHSIFTKGDRKYDSEWLNTLAQKVWDTQGNKENPNEEIDLLFSERLTEVEKPEAQKLPLDFTDGVEVYKKLIPFEADQMKSVEEYGGFFPILFFDEKTIIPMYHSDL